MRGKFFIRFFDHDAPNLLAVIVLAIRFFLPFRIASAKRLFVSVRNFWVERAGHSYDLLGGCLKLSKSDFYICDCLANSYFGCWLVAKNTLINALMMIIDNDVTLTTIQGFLTIISEGGAETTMTSE